MRKIMIATVLVLALILGYGAAKSAALERASKGGETSEVAKLFGKAVKNPQGEDLGRITDVVTGPQGRIAFAVLTYWLSDDTQKRIAVPFGALSCREHDCILNISKNMLDSAPTFALENDLVEPKLAEDIYTYFGLQPYWTEEGIQK
jgi:sporulation protein YlmC with PRC-barrel domain